MEVQGGSRTPQTDIDLTKEILQKIISEKFEQNGLTEFEENPEMLRTLFEERYNARLMSQFPGM